MAKPWYRTPDWTAKDEKRLAGRLKRYKSPFERAQVLRIKALHLEESGDTSVLPVIERLLRMVVDDPEIQSTCSNTAVACEVSICHLRLALAYSQRGENDLAEFHFRKDLEISKTSGNGVNFALFLSKADDIAKLEEAEHLLDEVRDTRDPPQLLFRESKLRYCVARARVCRKTNRQYEAADYATVALELDGGGGIDSFKRSPMDQPLLDEPTRDEMRAVIGMASEKE